MGRSDLAIQEKTVIVKISAPGTFGELASWCCPLCQEELPSKAGLTRQQFELAKPYHLRVCAKNKKKKIGLMQAFKLTNSVTQRRTRGLQSKEKLKRLMAKVRPKLEKQEHDVQQMPVEAPGGWGLLQRTIMACKKCRLRHKGKLHIPERAFEEMMTTKCQDYDWEQHKGRKWRDTAPSDSWMKPSYRMWDSLNKKQKEDAAEFFGMPTEELKYRDRCKKGRLE